MLFGRDAERAHLEQLLDAGASSPAGCILEGVAGIGKSTLWRNAVESARGRGYRVLQTAPSEPESVLAFSGVGDLFDRVPEDAFEPLTEVQARAMRAALSLGELPEGSPHHQALPRAVLGVLRRLSATGPVLIAIDDEQWLDPASARVLAFALRRLRDERIAVILARRPEPRGPLSAELGRGFGERGLETVPVEPLPMSTIKLLLEARVKPTISHPLLRRIHQGAGGNPLYALAIATELEARHASGDRTADLPIARTLGDAIELRLGHADERAGAAMLVIAALSHPTLAMLQAALPDFALSDLESAERAGVIEISGSRLRFTHPLLASTHYANTPASSRRELHRRLATVIDDEEERAQHIALGAEAPDREIADTLEKAASVAARRGATESAARLLEDAARLTPIDKPLAWSERIVAAAEYRFISGEVARAREMLEELLPDLRTGPLRARAGVQLAEIRGDEPKVAVELMEAALEDAAEDDQWRVKIESDLAVACSLVGRLGAGRAYAESAVRAAERLRDPNLLAKALGQLLGVFVSTGELMPRDQFARLSAMGECPELTSYYQPSTSIGLAHHFGGDVEAARPLLERAARRALARGEEWDRLGITVVLAELEWESGNHHVADQYRHTAEEGLGEYLGDLVWLHAVDARCALDRGELDVARVKAEHGLALAERNGAEWLSARLNQVLAGVELQSDQPESAHARLAKLREWLSSIGFGPAGVGKTPVWSQDVEALIALGRFEDAEQVLAELHARATVSGHPAVQAAASRSEGLLLGARGELVGAIDAMDRALAAHARCHRPLEHGRTLLEKGAIERRVKRKSDAKRTLEQALAILEPLGTEVWVSRTRDELSRIGLRRPRVTDGLTPAQARVAELVAAGLSNPQIARQLHMSLRTVESHLSRVYREYGVTSRSQLAATLGSASGPPD
ncbi:MAG TPA: AAA family ATPase [Solirubrobacteraceae bacterium]|nr:AAA family ATPase [Solirubrobacteraceae bacterium]